MAYTVLARRYRSATFDEVIGQEHIAQTLKKAIESGRIAHAYLFCGTRGTGKTSTARILAKCLNCESSDKPTATPCGKCNSCQAIARGEDIDVIEIDAASNTGVDNVRDLISNAQFRPARSRFKVYIIDEVHMLSKSAFNALLKTLEEPPEHVKFILATTEPEKVLPTILSRCQRYDFRNIPTREIAAHLKDITKKEKIKADDDALLLVAKAGSGSMRDSLSLLDRLLSIGEKELTVGMIEQLLGLPKVQQIFDLADAIGSGEVKQTLERADALVTGGLSVDSMLASLIDHLRNLMILRACGFESQLVEVPGLSPKDLQTQAQKFDPTALVQDIAILEDLRRQVRTSQAGRALLDATLARLALSDQFNSIGALAAQVSGAPSAPAAQKKKPELDPQPVAATPASPLSVVKNEEATQASQLQETAHATSSAPEEGDTSVAPTFSIDVEDDDEALPAVGRVWEGEKKSLSAIFKRSAAPAPAPVRTAPNFEAIGDNELSRVWGDLLQKFESLPGIYGMLKGGQPLGVTDDRAVIRFDQSLAIAPRMLEQNGKKEKLLDALKELLGRSVSVQFEVDESTGEMVRTPAPAQEAPRPARPMNRPAPTPALPPIPDTPTVPLTPELREELSKDPLIKAVIEQLGGQIIRVEPAES